MEGFISRWTLIFTLFISAAYPVFVAINTFHIQAQCGATGILSNRLFVFSLLSSCNLTVSLILAYQNVEDAFVKRLLAFFFSSTMLTEVCMLAVTLHRNS